MNGLSSIDIPYKTGNLNIKIHSNNNKNAVILLPGQSLPAEMFFGLPLYENGSSIADKIIQAGVDVIYLDPVGYGRSQGTITELYTRDIMADQMVLAVDAVRDRYTNIILHGFCSTGHVPMITATKVTVEGIVLQSPLVFKAEPEKIQEYMSKRTNESIILKNTLDNLKDIRLKRSDTFIGKSNKADNWEQVFLAHLQTFDNFPVQGEWFGSNDMVWDLWLYDSANNNQGWRSDLITCPIAVIKGEYDYECRSNYSEFLEIIKNKLVVEIVAPNATHFGMWDRDYDIWADSFINCLTSLLTAQ
jgi:pimeloyl-ACP methyl ester carboxylesterase